VGGGYLYRGLHPWLLIFNSFGVKKPQSQLLNKTEVTYLNKFDFFGVRKPQSGVIQNKTGVTYRNKFNFFSVRKPGSSLYQALFNPCRVVVDGGHLYRGLHPRLLIFNSFGVRKPQIRLLNKIRVTYRNKFDFLRVRKPQSNALLNKTGITCRNNFIFLSVRKPWSCLFQTLFNPCRVVVGGGYLYLWLHPWLLIFNSFGVKKTQSQLLNKTGKTYRNKFNFFEKNKPQSGLILITVGETHGKQYPCNINPEGVVYYTNPCPINNWKFKQII